ncbi:TadE/TadG family type IV pilus assembly protein [Parafrankia sp. BMG5.11]|uniref:TadE/TadG family type IV pilus assembly protein n=1 Tax=Parafrankia sp. BMG5.11 TaxID=222540 RepID=UPI001404B830|nr:TadE/TadG family type IV pilus assembly protein [Parafrankia sp. BMG5.11]
MTLLKFLRDKSGAAAAELALILPAFAFILLNVVDLSVYLYSKMQVDLAAQEAVGAARVLCDTDAELPATQGANCPALTATMLAAAQSTSLGSNVSLGTPAEAFYCTTSGGVLTQVAAIGATVPANCSAVVTGSTASPGNYIAVEASYPFSPVFPGASVAAFLPKRITRTAWLRLA